MTLHRSKCILVSGCTVDDSKTEWPFLQIPSAFWDRSPPPLSPLYGSAHSLLVLIKTPAPQARRCRYPQPKKPGPSCQECTAPEPGGRLMTLPTKKWIKWPQKDNKLEADSEKVSDGNKYWLTSYCVPFLDDSELPVETQIHLISASVRQRGLWGLGLISTACVCTRTVVCVKRMSKFSIYPFGNARAGSNFPILSPRFSKFVTSRFSQPWKFCCNQELRAKRKSVRGLKAPLISLTSRSVSLTGLFPGKGLCSSFTWTAATFTGSMLGGGAGRGGWSCKNETSKEFLRGLGAALFLFCFLIPKWTYKCCAMKARVQDSYVPFGTVWFWRGHLLSLGLTLPIRRLRGLEA